MHSHRILVGVLLVFLQLIYTLLSTESARIMACIAEPCIAFGGRGRGMGEVLAGRILRLYFRLDKELLRFASFTRQRR